MHPLFPGQPCSQGVHVVRDFAFGNGQTLPELKLAYTTLGPPSGQPVLVLHGTGGTGGGLLTAAFGGELFGPGKVLDAARHFIILPDAIGGGGSSKPSDGLRMAFPAYGYADMVRAQHMLVRDHFGIGTLKLILGYSMGGMHTFMWGSMYPDAADNLVALAATPAEVAGRNWMTRRMLIDTIKLDPAWNEGNYNRQPAGLALAQAYFNMATNGGDQHLHRLAGSHAAADSYVDAQLAIPARGDANDLIYQFAASRDYAPGPHLEKITARLLAITSADDERNPPHLGLMEPAMARVANGAHHLIPASAETCGHATCGQARWWSAKLAEFLDGAQG